MKESIHKLHIHSITQLTNFVDALLLVLYRDGEVSPQWSTLRVEEQKRIVLSLSISLQCLCNLLSASKTLNQLIPSRLQALLSVLVTGRRARLLLGQSDCPLSISGSAHGNRVLSYAAILYYSVLLHLESIHGGLETGTSELIAHKLIVDPVVFRSVIFHCSRPVPNDDNAEVQSQLHYRLLLSKLADILSVYKLQTLCVHDAGDLRTPEEELEMSVHATGLVLIFRSNDLNFTTNPDVIDATEPRPVVQTIRSCLVFYGLTAIGCGSPIDRFQRLLIIFDHQCTSWIAALLHLMETNPSGSEILHSKPTESAFPFAVLRGVVHLMSESVFSDLSNRKNPALFLESSGESVEQFWNRACDLIILLNTASQWLDRLFPSPVQPEQRRAVNGSTCTVHPSRMTRKWPSLPSTSPLSLCQTVGFLHDFLRSMTGLISTFPRLTFALASHSHQFEIPEAVSRLDLQPTKTAFQCILDATNRDRVSPLASEWAILLIKLAVNPESTDEKALEGAKLLSAELTDLQLIS